MSIPLIEFSAQSIKDKYYWPIVRKTYLDLKDAENKRKTQLQNMLLQIKPVMPGKVHEADQVGHGKEEDMDSDDGENEKS